MPVVALPPSHAATPPPLISVAHNAASLGWPYKIRSSDQADIMNRILDMESPNNAAGIVCQWPRSLAQIHPKQIRITVKNGKRVRKVIPANPLTCVVSVTIPGGRYASATMSFTTNIWEIWEDGSFIYTGPSVDPATD